MIWDMNWKVERVVEDENHHKTFNDAYFRTYRNAKKYHDAHPGSKLMMKCPLP